MFKRNKVKILIKESTIFDYQPPVSQEKRTQIVKYIMAKHPSFVVKGGDSLSNPYKIPYEIALADRMDNLEKYKKSILWSPRFTPWHFKTFFLYPAFFVAVLIWYIHNVAIPRRMVYLKKKYGYVFPELERKNWLDEWWDYNEDEEADTMGFNPIEMKFTKTKDKLVRRQYTDMTLADLQNLDGRSIPTEEEQDTSKFTKVESKEMKDYKHKMQNRLQKMASQRSS